jgi:tRNA A37 threonylcarbamoyladenosine modification protein TsaB
MVKTDQKILVIDTTQREQVNVALWSQKKTVRLSIGERAQSLPNVIAQLLHKARTSLEEIDAIAVCNQPGSLTGTRMGVTAANTLGWLRSLPLIELPTNNFPDALRQISDGKKFRSKKPVKVARELMPYR